MVVVFGALGLGLVFVSVCSLRVLSFVLLCVFVLAFMFVLDRVRVSSVHLCCFLFCVVLSCLFDFSCSQLYCLILSCLVLSCIELSCIVLLSSLV
jgi:hypothetical protein